MKQGTHPQPEHKRIVYLLASLEEALKISYYIHTALGEQGRQETGEVNEFGNKTYKADIEAGRAVFNYFRKNDISLLMVSEEHGSELKIADNPEMLGVIDELDGSISYKKGTGRYGTMVSIFDNLNPNYGDYLVSGILDYRRGEIYTAGKGSGSFVMKVGSTEKLPILCSRVMSLDSQRTRISIDGAFDINVPTFVDKLLEFEKVFVGNENNGGASSAYYMDLARGEVDLVLECTRKRNLEIACAYGLIAEAGGSVVDLEGDDLGGKKYLEYGQKPDDRIPIISAATFTLARNLIFHLRKNE